MNSYFFVLGRALALCKTELSYFLAQSKLRDFPSDPSIVLTENSSEIDLQSLMRYSGGIVKCGEIVLADLPIDSTNLLDTVVEAIHKQLAGHSKIRYGVSAYGVIQNFDLVGFIKEIKGRLQESVSASYILPEKNELSSVQLEKNKLVTEGGVEIVLLLRGQSVSIGVTRVIQPFELWSGVDYGRPSRDSKSGMLPPKVARMMVNLGLGAYTENKSTVDAMPLVYDPFCGSGTVLMESLRVGARAIGSDFSPKAVADSRENLMWFYNSGMYTHADTKHPFFKYPIGEVPQEDLRVFESEVAHIDTFFKNEKVPVIVCEPYLGPTFSEEPTPGKLERIIKGLEKLYIGAMRSLHDVLDADGVLVFAEPQFFMHEKTYKVGIIDRYDRFGYTLQSTIVEYNREKAFVGRRIAVLKKE